jgi:hypothetical protein
MVEEVIFSHAKVEIEEIEELSLHEIDFGQAEAKSVIPLDAGIPGPVLVLRTGVVEVLGSKNQRGKEDAMDCTTHALCNWRKTRSETVEVYQGCHQGWYLY